MTKIISVLIALMLLMSGALTKTDMKDFLKTTDIEKGWSNDNNGYPSSGEDVERLISVKPTKLQADFADLEYYSFIHYGMNTFTNVEWGTGKEDPSQFNPEKVDTDQWCKVLKESGSKGIIFTAKHHDGFCLFQTEYTDHSIKNSPYKNGKGDIVAELAESCKKYDLKLGIYLSPWDRHEKTYGHDEYNDYFVNQLTELCTNYGEIFVFWFDGAKGDDAPDFTYDFERYYEVIRTLQPGAIIANCGPDVRWIGNEAGQVRKNEWSVISSGSASVEKTMEGSQHNTSDAETLQEINYMDPDLGSREIVLPYRDLVWKQGEADVSIHYDWFYHKHSKARTAKLLTDIYFKTVGGNALMLLNVPPSKDGIIVDKDIKILKKFKANVDKAFTNKLDISVNNTLNSGSSYILGDNENGLTINLESKSKIKTIVIQEDTGFSQRVEGFDIYIKTKDKYIKTYSGTVIGSKKIVKLPSSVIPKTDEIKIVFTQSRSNPVIRNIEVYGA